MFLDQLEFRQKCSFLALVTRVTLGDGDLAPQEEAVLAASKAELGDDVVAPPEEVFGVTNAAVFSTRRSRRLAFLELLVSAHADGKIHPDECTVLNEISDAFELDQEIINTLSDWARRRVESSDTDLSALKIEAESLIGG